MDESCGMYVVEAGSVARGVMSGSCGDDEEVRRGEASVVTRRLCCAGLVEELIEANGSGEESVETSSVEVEEDETGGEAGGEVTGGEAGGEVTDGEVVFTPRAWAAVASM